MGDRFCGTHSAPREEDGSTVHYHYNEGFDSMGRGTACEGLHRCDYCEVPLGACTNTIGVSKDFDE